MTTNTELPEGLALIPPGSRVLCAVSGGSDSMCLLHLLWTQQEERNLRVLAAHYEHGLRGEESLRDARFVESWCRERGIPCVVGHGDVASYAREKGLGLEEAARELRYAFLEQTAAQQNCDWIVTAHTADDNAETLLLNMCRGSGGRGLMGIPPRRGKILRPLLSWDRPQIEAYLQAQKVEHVEDSSNDSDVYARNRIRHRVLPALRELNPRFSQAALRTAALLRQDEDCLGKQAHNWLAAHFDGESLPVGQLLQLHPAIAGRVLRAVCPRSLSQRQTEALLAFCAGRGLGYLDLPGLRVRREQGRLFVTETERRAIPPRTLQPEVPLTVPEAGLCLEMHETDCIQQIYDLFKTYLFKCENICGSIICTGRLPGDRIRPLGRGCSKSLKALFHEAGMTQAERDRCLVLRDDKGVLAVYGLALDERTAAQPGDRVFRIELKKQE